MDLKQLEINETADLPVKDSSGMLLPGVSITLYGPASTTHREAKARWFKRNKKLSDQDEAGFIESNAKFYADCTKSFNNLDYEGLEGRELYLAVYRNPALGFVGRQVLDALGDWGKFSKIELLN